MNIIGEVGLQSREILAENPGAVKYVADKLILVTAELSSLLSDMDAH